MNIEIAKAQLEPILPFLIIALVILAILAIVTKGKILMFANEFEIIFIVGFVYFLIYLFLLN